MEVEIEVQKNSDGKDKKKYEEYEIKQWAETLLSAEEIKNDAEKMALLKPYLDKKVKAIRSIADLKDIAKEKMSKMKLEKDEEY